MELVLYILGLAGLGHLALGYPEEGKWHKNLTSTDNMFVTFKSLFKGSQIFVDISCKSDPPNEKLKISWYVTKKPCFYDRIERLTDAQILFTRDNRTVTIDGTCGEHINLERIEEGKGPPLPQTASVQVKLGNSPEASVNQNVNVDNSKRKKREVTVPGNVKKLIHPKQGPLASPIFTAPIDGFYEFVISIDGSDFDAEIQVEMHGDYGYLSAADWPLLPFYGAMCLIYIIYGAVWLLVSFCQWRDLLRIQFWIGGVILLGMLEKATFYAEYQNINNNGVTVKSAVLLAEWVSCSKRTLARMLVIIVSLGFGIVKPRLGPMLHRVVGLGACYFILAVVESYMRVVNPKNDPSSQLIATIPLAVLDSGICWWIFTSLVQTTRTLRLRRNLIKLNLYRHFTNTLIFAVMASVIFMLYSIKAHRFANCLTDWKELWVDEAYWHILFSVLLLVIMILWRPTNNNQRYAFTPLLDAADDDEEEDQFVNDAYGVKMRTHSRASSPKPKPSSDDDILKWVDENIPSAGVETALPILDSEEEILTTKFEVSKMQ